MDIKRYLVEKQHETFLEDVIKKALAIITLSIQ
jgi:hypothetical protein